MRKEEVFESFTVVSVVVGMDPGARAVISDAVLGPVGLVHPWRAPRNVW